MLGVGFGLNAWVGTALGYAGAIAVWTIGEVLFAPASTSLVADLAPPDLRGRYQGAFAVVFTAAFAAAPAVGGYIIARWCALAVDRLLRDLRGRRDGILPAERRRSPTH